MERQKAFQAINELERAVQDLLSLGNLGSLEDRRRLIEIRRLLPGLFKQVEIEAERCLAGANNEVPVRDFRQRFSAMRHSVSVHQASWSVAIIDADLPGYGASLKNAHKHFEETMSWLRLTLATA